MTNSNQRPLGITLLAAWLLLNSIGRLVLALYRISSSSDLVLEEALLFPKYSLVAIDGFIIVFSIWVIMLSIGLWKMRRWSWIGTLITQGINGLIAILVGLFGWLSAEGFSSSDWFMIIAESLFTAVTIYYLLRPNIKSAFRVH